MAGIADYFKRKKAPNTQTELSITSVDFKCGYRRLAVMNLYSKIMHECADRAAVPEQITNDAYVGTVYDSFSPAKRGLVSIIVYAMTTRNQVFFRKEKLADGSIVFISVTEKEAANEKGDILPDYIELDFREFYESEILHLLYSLLADINQAMSNGVAVSQSMLVKIHALSDMIENSQNLEPLREQLTQLESALKGTSLGYVDAQSSVESVKFDTAPAKEASEYVYAMISSVTGVPASYLFSDIVGGLGDMSNSEERRLNMAMKRYFNSIMRGALYAAFDRRFEYKMLVVDIDQMISLFSWIETTNLITDDAKKKVMINNTVFTEEDMNVLTKIPEPVTIVEPEVPVVDEE